MTSRSLRAAGCTFSVAGRDDEPALRELLRSNSLGGWVRLSFQREPDAFAGTFGLHHSHDFIIAREERSGRPVGLCERFVTDAYIDGDVRRLPYLGSLRVQAEFRNRIRILRTGFAAVRDWLADPRDMRSALTAITADNHIARRALTSGIAGFPTYVPAGELLTFAIRTRRCRPEPLVRMATDAHLPDIASFLQETYQRYQFARVWRLEYLQQLARSGALPASSFVVLRRDGRTVGCVALWDQGAVKQTVVSGYSKPVALMRPLINIVAPLLGAPRLPPAGNALKQVYLSHFAVQDESAADALTLLRAALGEAHRRGFELAVIGLAANHPLADVVRREWRTREYRSLLYLVQWPERSETCATERWRIPHPEVALM